MQSTTVSGCYPTSNRFCESTFGLLKNREEASPKAALDTTVLVTVAKMNGLKTYLEKMSTAKKEKLWAEIDDKSSLKDLLVARKNLKKELREQSKLAKETKRAKIQKIAENKRRREVKAAQATPKIKKTKILKKLPISQ